MFYPFRHSNYKWKLMNEQTKYISISFAINTLFVLVALLVGAIIYIFMRQHEPKFFCFIYRNWPR